MNNCETKTSIICYNPDEGFLRVSSKPDSEIELEDAKHDFEVAAKLVNNTKLPVLADSRQVTYHSKEVRAFYASKEMADSISSMAILVDSLATKIIGNFFIKSSRPHFPTKLFTDETEAVKWLAKISMDKKVNSKN